jgi:hypothetical protein
MIEIGSALEIMNEFLQPSVIAQTVPKLMKIL